MERTRVLLDTNILISGLVFLKGNEHQVLRLLEAGEFTLIIPETVILEARRVLETKFEGFEDLVDIFLGKITHEVYPVESILRLAPTHRGAVRDQTDLPIYITTLQTRPDYAVTGDKKLRGDIKGSEEIGRYTRICTSREFIAAVKKE